MSYDAELARDITASVLTGFVLAMQNAGLSNREIGSIVEDATLLTKVILSAPEVPISPQHK